jgi:transposase-like protein
VTAGTIFEGTRKPLRLWFQAAWEITSRKAGASALGVQRVLGLKSYKTAWAWLHKFRVAMVRPDRDPLSGQIEVDETYVGGEEGGVLGRRALRRAIVVIAVELRGERPARIRLRHVPDVRTDALVGFVTDVAAPGSTIRTDGWRSYKPLARHGFVHRRTELASFPEPAHVVMPNVHRVASLLKRWLLGTHQGAVSQAQLEYYFDEFTFRFNRRTSRARGLLFYRLVSQASRTDPIPTSALFKDAGRGPGKSKRSRHKM